MAFFCFSLVVDLFPCVYFVGTITVFFFFPLVILVCVYALIARSLMTHPTTPRPTGVATTVPSQSVIKYRKQVIMMLGAVVVAFFVCLLPFRALTLWVIIAPEGPMVQMGPEHYYNLLYFSRIMLYINSAVNPILYNVMSSKFRGGFLRLCGARGRQLGRAGRPGDVDTKSSSTHASSRQTSDSFLKGGSRGQRADEAKGGNLTRNVYVRAPPLAAPKGEIYV